MTDDELREYIRLAKAEAPEVYFPHAAWQTIAYAEAILAGQPSRLSRKRVESNLVIMFSGRMERWRAIAKLTGIGNE
jgi:hypothetical protein